MKKQIKKPALQTGVTKKRLRERTAELLEAHAVSIAKRIKGQKKHDKGNVGFKQTPSEVFVFLVIANEQLRNSYQEKFKNTRNFKKTIAFETVEQLIRYLEEYQFPKTSIFLAIIDHFFENVSEEEQKQGIALMQKLQQQDPAMELIMLSEQHDSSSVKTNAGYGLVTYIKETDGDSFKQILNCMIVAIHEQNKIRKQYDTKKMLKKGSIAAGIILVLLIVIDYITGAQSATGNGLIGVLPPSVFGK
ncbi:MAG: hypothetical protein LBM68_06265 [Bacteroidales bacterium]|jgi:DNA-binding NarL/FixJ family response regulator|nr:hypothetical protein [Bacteroidales bacterium]